MARRSRDWSEGLAQNLRNREFAREFPLATMDEGIPIQTALALVDVTSSGITIAVSAASHRLRPN